MPAWKAGASHGCARASRALGRSLWSCSKQGKHWGRVRTDRVGGLA